MLEVIKAALNTTTGAAFIRQDLSSVVTLTDEYDRPLLQSAPQVQATSTLHEWDEIGLQTAGFSNYAAGGATYAESALPAANAKTAAKKNNTICKTGRLAQVSDTLKATWTQGGRFSMAVGEEERMMAEAIDLATALVVQECLNQVELMHIAGDSTNAEAIEGGQCDGLFKWSLAGGAVVATGGTATTPITMAEAFIKTGAKSQALAYAAVKPNRMLVAPELIADINSYVANGAARPIVTIANGDNTGLTAGNDVGWYNTGYSKLQVKEEPYLSPTLNPHLSNPAIVAYHTSLVKHANLIPLGAEPLARRGTSTERQVTIEYTQEHRMPKHTFVIQNVKSAF